MDTTMQAPPGVKTYSKSQNRTAEKIKKFLPKGSSHQVTQNILNIIEDTENSTGILQEYYEESFLAHTPLFKEMKVDLLDYVNAIKYVTLAANMSNRAAWEIVFPESMKRLEELKAKREVEGRAASVNIDSHVSNYNKSAIVVALQTRMAIAPSILYMKEFDEAMRVKLQLMRGISQNGAPVSATVQLNAAIAVTDKTQMPVDNNIVLKVGHTDEAKEATQRMTNQMASVAKAIQDAVAAGQSVESVQALNLTHGGLDDSDIIDVDAED